MNKVRIGLISREGDQLGHLVRGVQMLRSYGHEFEIEHYSDLLSIDIDGVSTAGTCCFVDGNSAVTIKALQDICRQTEWAMGNRPATLQVWLVQYDENWVESAPQPFIEAERQESERTVYMGAAEFREICDWGQQAPGSGSEVIGEWPSATGE